MKAVIFDLDGTLIDSLPDLRAALNIVLAQNGRRPVTPKEIKTMVGSGSEKLLEQAFQLTGRSLMKKDFTLCFNAFTSYYQANHASKTTVFEGVLSTLKILSKKGVKLGVCTNKPHDLAIKVLRSFKLDHYLPVCIGKGKLPYHKPDRRHYDNVASALGVKPHESLYVGDSETDVKTARNAGVPLILVSYGYSREPATTLGGDYLIGHFSELPAVLGQRFIELKTF